VAPADRPVVTWTPGSPIAQFSLPLAWTTARRSPLRSWTRISTPFSLVAFFSTALPMTPPMTAPSTPPTAESR
jgi:hypothetical protein